MKLNLLREKLTPLISEYRLACSQVSQEKKALQEAKEHLQNILEAQKLIQTIAKQVQQSAHKQVASVVSKCLETVFDDPYEFVIDFQEKRQKTEAVLSLVRDGLVLDDPQNSTGGGVIDVVSFALRLVSILLSRPKKRRFLLLDEPMKMLSKEYRPRVRGLLESLSQDLNFQILMVTHSQEIACGKIIHLGE